MYILFQLLRKRSFFPFLIQLSFSVLNVELSCDGAMTWKVTRGFRVSDYTSVGIAPWTVFRLLSIERPGLDISAHFQSNQLIINLSGMFWLKFLLACASQLSIDSSFHFIWQNLQLDYVSHFFMNIAAGMTKPCCLSSITGRKLWQRNNLINSRYILQSYFSWN